MLFVEMRARLPLGKKYSINAARDLALRKGFGTPAAGATQEMCGLKGRELAQSPSASQDLQGSQF